MHGSGDVKYHLGAEGTFTGLDGEQIKVSLTANPSHLEAVDPVVEGVSRAKQDIINKAARTSPSCRSSCTVTRRSPARVWSPRR